MPSVVFSSDLSSAGVQNFEFLYFIQVSVVVFTFLAAVGAVVAYDSTAVLVVVVEGYDFPGEVLAVVFWKEVNVLSALETDKIRSKQIKFFFILNVSK